MKILNKFKNNKGYAMLEILFYIALFAILSIAVIDAMITMTKSFKETTVHKELMQGGNIMEKITREIRQASGINSISADSLKINSTNIDETSKTVEFSLSGTDVRFLENDIFIGNLNTTNVSVLALSFTQINTTKGTAIKIFLTVKSNHDLQNREESFYDTIVLRGGY